jgi:hypothetical protein
MQPHLASLGSGVAARARHASVIGVVALLAIGSLGLVPAFSTVGSAHGSATAAVGSATVSPAIAPLPQVAPAVSSVNVTFKALGLPNGSNWSVTTPANNETGKNTTFGHVGRIVLLEPNNTTVNFSISGPSGFGVAKVVGPGQPSQTSAFINGSETITVVFGPIETLTFTETGLASGTVWGIALRSALPHGGPAPQSASSNGTTISFTVVRGTYHFNVTVPADYRATPPKGAVGTGHPEKTIRFHLVTAPVIFQEIGLTHGTLWQVNVTSGAFHESLNSTRSSIRFNLPSGNYTFTVWNFSAVHPHPESGSFTVTAPGNATVEEINYTATPVAAGALPATVMPAPLFAALAAVDPSA